MDRAEEYKRNVFKCKTKWLTSQGSLIDEIAKQTSFVKAAGPIVERIWFTTDSQMKLSNNIERYLVEERKRWLWLQVEPKSY